MHFSKKLAKATTLGLGALLVTGIMAPSVSAATDTNGIFTVKAEDKKDNSIVATAGFKALPSTNIDGSDSNGDDGGGEENPGDNETNPPKDPDPETPGVVSPFKMDCGPMAITIDDQIISYAKVAEDLAKEGKADQVGNNPEGWKYLSTSNSVSGSLTMGWPEDTSQIIRVILGEESSLNNYKTFGYKTPDTCSILDYRTAKEPGNVVQHMSTSDGKTEGRYVEEEGKLNLAVVEDSNIKKSVERFEPKSSSSDNAPSRSDVLPHYYGEFSNGGKRADIRPKTGADVVPKIGIELNQDGSGYVSFVNNRNSSINKEDGPQFIRWDKNKRIDQLTYKSKNGGWTRSMDGISDPVAYYNKETGQNWDGDYPQLEDYDLTIPFTPTGM